MVDTPELKPIVGQGHPLSPDRGKLLSADDEKRIDEKGRPVVSGKLWSQAGTGMYLVVLMRDQPLQSDIPIVGRTDITLGLAFGGSGSTVLTVGVSKGGVPRFAHEYVGAALELPDDLGNDAMKRSYVIEWLVETVRECFQVRRIALPNKDSSVFQDLGMAVAAAAQKAIEGSQL
jgi:hypothetical protein